MLMALVHDTGSRIRGCARLHTQHCSVLEENIVEVLDEYSGVIHTLPVSNLSCSIKRLSSNCIRAMSEEINMYFANVRV